MLATTPPVRSAGRGWAFESGRDGVRAVVAVAGGRIRLTSRLGNEVTDGYPELAEIGALTQRRPALLDGEIVTLDEAGRPNFNLLQDRHARPHPTPELRARVPVWFYAFDLLLLDGRSLLHVPYDERRAQLDELEPTGRVQIPPSFSDVTGDQLLDIARQHGLEGVVAKRRASRYEPDPAFARLAENRTVAQAGGADRRVDSRRGAACPHFRLAPARGVRRGTAAASTRPRRYRVQRRAARPAHGTPAPADPADQPVRRERLGEHARYARWAEPVLVGEVEYRVITRDGRSSHASWQGLRLDRAPDEVVLPAS